MPVPRRSDGFTVWHVRLALWQVNRSPSFWEGCPNPALTRTVLDVLAMRTSSKRMTIAEHGRGFAAEFLAGDAHVSDKTMRVILTWLQLRGVLLIDTENGRKVDRAARRPARVLAWNVPYLKQLLGARWSD
jgi:hypothetical protein